MKEIRMGAELIIAGFPKCGSTALLDALEAAPGVVGLRTPEGGKEIVWPQARDLRRAEVPEGGVRVHKYVAYMYNAGARRWLGRVGKRSLIVLCIRDPRKALVSWHNMYRAIATAEHRSNHIAWTERDFYATCSVEDFYARMARRLRYDVLFKQLVRQVPRSQIVVVTQERLARDMDGVVAYLLARARGENPALPPLPEGEGYRGYADRSEVALDPRIEARLGRTWRRLEQAISKSRVTLCDIRPSRRNRMHQAEAHILDKKTLFDLADRLPRVARHITQPHPRLKFFQDAAAFGAIQLHARRAIPEGPVRVADIGGDQSRLIQMLQKADPRYACTIIDTWQQSVGNGTVTRPELPGVELIDCLLGTPEARALVPDASFDIVTSISVVEHVPDEALEAFFRDCLRICRPGGRILHYVDLHLSDSPENPRGAATLAAMNAALGREVLSIPDWRFRAGYISNPDDLMFRWGQRGGNLRFRAAHQAACLVIAVTRAAEG